MTPATNDLDALAKESDMSRLQCPEAWFSLHRFCEIFCALPAGGVRQGHVTFGGAVFRSAFFC